MTSKTSTKGSHSGTNTLYTNGNKNVSNNSPPNSLENKKALVLPLPESKHFLNSSPFPTDKNINLATLSPGFFNSVDINESLSLQDEFMGILNQDEKLKHLAMDSGVLENTIPQLSRYDQEQKQESKKRKIPDVSFENNPQPEKKKKLATTKPSASRAVNGDKATKGLRHFSLKVCEKVEQKKITNYNQVASELVAESKEIDESEQKNIRRRVYDALNVFIALGIITKEKKDIKWKGRPTGAHQEVVTLERDKKILEESIAQKQKELDELCAQRDAYKKLISRNPDPSTNENSEELLRSRIYLPFIIVNTKNDMIECEVNETRSAYFFSFRQPFEIHDDSEILKRMKL